jgi:hypothetical protein
MIFGDGYPTSGPMVIAVKKPEQPKEQKGGVRGEDDARSHWK